MARTMTLPVQISMLGRFHVIRGEDILSGSDWDRQKAATLLQRLALERHLLRDQVIDFLWPDASQESGANNLYQTLYSLRRFLTAKLGKGAAEELFAFHNGVLYLNSSVQVDVHEFRSLCSQNQSINDPKQLDRLQQALRLYQGDFLPDERYAEWTIVPRDSLHRLYRQAALVLTSHYQEHRNYDSALTLLTPLLSSDPTDEPVHRAMMRIYAHANHRHAALQQYQACVEALSHDLGVTPEQETKDLYTQILKGEIAPLPAISPKPVSSLPLLSMTEKKQYSECFGRDSEIDWLAARTFGGQQNTGCVILLAGDPGIGKTHLASEVLQRGAASGLLCLSGTAHEHEGQPSYQPFIEAFDHYLSEYGQTVLLNPITSFRPAGFSDPQLEHAALLRAIRSFLTELTTQAPVLLFLDDLHAADEASLQLFHYLARQTREIPLILLAAYRPDLTLNLLSPFSRLLNALYREQLSETLLLPPLDETATADLIARILRGVPEPELVKRIWEITEGNPFFIREIIHAIVRTDQIVLQEGRYILLSPDALAVPSSLRSFLRERIERLGPELVSVLTIGALIGRQFSFTIIQYASELPDDQVLDALDIALAGQILIETAGGYRFSHAIIRQTLYDSLSHLRQMHLHTQVAEAIEQVYIQHDSKIHVSIEDLAFHYNRSNRREKALPYLLQAGQKAAAAFAFEVATHYFEQAQTLMETLDLHNPQQYLNILEQLGWWRIILADTPRAVASFEQALALTPESGWRLRTGDYLRLHRAAARALITAGKIADAEAHLRTALKIFHDEQEDSAAGAYLFYDVALLHWHLNDYKAAGEAAQRSREIAANLGNDDALARAYEALALISHSLGDWQQGYTYEMERAHLTGLGLDVTEAFDVHLCLWEYYLYSDVPYETLKQMVDTMLQQAQRMSAPRAIALCQCFGGALEFQVGHWEQAAAMLQESIRLHRQIGSAAGEALACQRLGVLFTAQGEIDKALRVLEEGILAGERAIMRAHCLIRLYAALTRNRLDYGDIATAQQTLRLGMNTRDRHGNCKSCDSLLLPVAVSVSIVQNDLTLAGEFCQQLDNAAARYHSHAWRAMASKANGELELARKNYQQAFDAFTAATRDFEAAGYVYEAQQCALLLSSLRSL